MGSQCDLHCNSMGFGLRCGLQCVIQSLNVMCHSFGAIVNGIWLEMCVVCVEFVGKMPTIDVRCEMLLVMMMFVGKMLKMLVWGQCLKLPEIDV